ncbi:hypothetical protein E4U09_000286 [Claviceps aff. purpurea]|uniref:Pre-mRNA-splicing factor n=1 Tax=Claviceps aff. purpurea TaxID=1967640 RepID=A0A9P7U075_9HYPO|nr:hypothetical protein E4U09_000286 [Claviceps aff. purpurea]
MSDPSKGRIAIKLGSSSKSTSTSRPSPRDALPGSTLGKRSRQTTRTTVALGDESDSESESDSQYRRHETIVAFGQDGAETDRATGADQPREKQYVIARQPNRDWRSELKAQRRSKNLLPEEAQQQQNDHSQNSSSAKNRQSNPAEPDDGLKWGLTIAAEKKADADQGATDDCDGKDAEQTQKAQKQTSASASAHPPNTKPRTDDEEAIDALLGKKTGPERRIPALSEDEVYKRDAAGAGAASTLEDYEAMPVEEFGAALLRGMGWNGEPTGPKVKQVRRRPNRLGLGAEELKDAEDLGAWNQKGTKGKSRPRLADYRREESRRKEERTKGREDSYKRERERERERDKERERGDARGSDRHRDKRQREGYREERRDRNGYRDSHRDRRR